MFRDGAPEQDYSAGKGEQCQGMAEPPGQAVLDDVADVSAARGDAGHRGDMIGLERVLHTQQKPQSQNSEHLPPHRLIAWPATVTLAIARSKATTPSFRDG